MGDVGEIIARLQGPGGAVHPVEDLQLLVPADYLGLPVPLKSHVPDEGYHLAHVAVVVGDKGSVQIASSISEGTEVKIYLPVNLEASPIQTSLRMRPVIYEDPSELIFTEVDQIVDI